MKLLLWAKLKCFLQVSGICDKVPSNIGVFTGKAIGADITVSVPMLLKLHLIAIANTTLFEPLPNTVWEIDYLNMNYSLVTQAKQKY